MLLSPLTNSAPVAIVVFPAPVIPFSNVVIFAAPPIVNSPLFATSVVAVFPVNVTSLRVVFPSFVITAFPLLPVNFTFVTSHSPASSFTVTEL